MRRALIGVLFVLIVLWGGPTSGKPRYLPPDTPDFRIPGFYMRAFLSAYEAFKQEARIPLSKKSLENYRVYFRQDTEHAIITFVPTGMPELKGGVTPSGVEVRYEVRKADYKVVRTEFAQ